YVCDQAHGGLTSGFTASPNGLISAAVQWLEGLGPLSNGNSNVDTNTLNDAGLPAKTVISDSAGSDYTVKSGVITLGGTALSSSDASWSTFSTTPVFTDNGTNGFFSHPSGQNNVYADGEGLKNALEASKTGKFVVSTDGTMIGWAGTGDTHHNDPGAFWGILADQHVTGVHWG